MEIIAHRGGSHDAPENTLASVRLGFAQGADAVEVDARLSLDGAIVLMHDQTTARTAGVDRPVVEQTLSELRRLDAGGWKGAQFAGEPVPTLDEAISDVPPGKRLVIEVKCGPEIMPALVACLKEAKRPADTFRLIAFGYDTLWAVKQALPGIEAYWLSGFSPDAEGGFSPALSDLIERAASAGFDGLNLSHRGPVDRNFVQAVQRAGLKCLIWTVDDPSHARRFADAGVDALTTNRPAYLIASLSDQNGWP